MMPVDSHAFVSEWKGKPIDGKSTTHLLELLKKLYSGFAAIVEQVREGTTLRVRLLMPDGEHQMVNIALAGVRSARASSKQGEPSEPYGEEVGSLYPLNIILPISFPSQRQNITQNPVYFNALSEYKYYLYRIQPQFRFKMLPMLRHLHLLVYLLGQVKRLVFNVQRIAKSLPFFISHTSGWKCRRISRCRRFGSRC